MGWFELIKESVSRSKFDAKMQQTIVDLYKAGKSPYEIAHMINKSKMSVINVLRLHNIPLRNMQQATKKKWSDQDMRQRKAEQMKQLWEARKQQGGLTYEDLMNQANEEGF